MLSRRHLRIRVMQALYAWYQSEERNAQIADTELFRGTARMFTLYLQLLQFLLEIAHQEEIYYADTPASMLTGRKKVAARSLHENSFIVWLKGNKEYQQQVQKNKISWQNEMDVVRKAYYELRKMAFYTEYIATENTTMEADIDFAKKVVGEIISKKDFVRHVVEENNIYWEEGFEVVCSMIIRTIESGNSKNGFSLSALYKDEEEDMAFMKNLLHMTIRDDEYFTKLIADRTESWDTERIALVDILLMKMALCEILHISNIPVKVSINEYIDISKDYSTPNSKGFINGVIDNIVIALKKDGKIVKTGRGLVE